jgi:hypothetical protein
VVDSCFMVGSAITVGILVAFGVPTAEVLVLLTLTALPMAFLTARHAPRTRIGRIALRLWPRGPG